MTDPTRLHHLQMIREYELQQVLPLFTKTAHILEIGAGSGWQANYLSERGYWIDAVDIPESQYLEKRVFPIILYDGPLYMTKITQSYNIVLNQ
ncbi:MAG: hypothetical protein ACOYMW_08735, partial [Candidatus Competibacteraceae bacterium]